MTTARAKAPTLAWFLTVLTGLLAGMAIVESQHPAVALPHPAGIRQPPAVVETAEVADSPAGTSEPTPPPPLTPLVEDVPIRLSAGPAVLRVARLTVPPGVRLPPEVASGPTVLLVKTGALSVRVDGVVWVGQGLDAAQSDTVLGLGERLFIAPGLLHAVRNDGPAPAVALVVTIIPVEAATPMLGPGEPPLRGTT